jgi:hypothetical protein
VVAVPVEGGAKTPHPRKVRERALQRASVVGPSAAADELNLSVDTVKSWQKRESAKAHRELARANLVLPARSGLSWPERRKELLGALSELATEAVAASRLAVQENRAKCAADFAAVAARALDKAILLGGGVTSRSESRSLALHVAHEGLEEVQREGRAIVQAREAQLAEGES